MARRYSGRGIARSRVYRLKLAARLVGVSEATFRKWPRQGLKIIDDRRPYLVRGEDLIDFLKKRQAANKAPMCEGQFYCMRCKAPRDPRAGSVQFSPLTSRTGRLSATCGHCGAKVGRFCKAPEQAG